jgi:hypothetical protein
MMKRELIFIIIVGILLNSCTSNTVAATPEQLTVQFTAASATWLTALYDCAGTDVIQAEQRAADFLNLQATDVVIRIGLPEHLTSHSYQVGTEDILVIVNPQNPVRHLSADQARGLFTGQIVTWKTINDTNAPVQVWVFPDGEDVQQIFEQKILGGSPVSSLARLANNPDEMSNAVSIDVNAIGLVTRHWKTGNTSDVFVAAGSLPVLAITRSEPKGTLAEILACLQK